ncbi:hypothetical protein [Streptosporangium saharense]
MSAAVEERTRAAESSYSEFGLDFPAEEPSVSIVRAVIGRIAPFGR